MDRVFIVYAPTDRNRKWKNQVKGVFDSKAAALQGIRWYLEQWYSPDDIRISNVSSSPLPRSFEIKYKVPDKEFGSPNGCTGYMLVEVREVNCITEEVRPVWWDTAPKTKQAHPLTEKDVEQIVSRMLDEAEKKRQRQSWLDDYR